jgi:hypothetical protein
MKIQNSAGEMPVIEPKAIRILSVVADGDGAVDKKEFDKEVSDFCVHVTDVRVNFEEIF